MNLKNVYTASSVLGMIFGLMLVLIPASFFSAYGVEISDALILTGRLLGAAYIGFSVIAWSARSVSDSSVGNTVLLGYVISYAIGLVVSLIAQLGGVVNALGWSTVLIMLLFTLGFGYFQFVKKES
jgi:hypothetical protein